MKKIVLLTAFSISLTCSFSQTQQKKTIKDSLLYIRTETIGGKLDYNIALKNDPQKFYLLDGIAYNKKDYAIYLWAKKVRTLGVASSDKAKQLWQDIYDRALTDPEERALIKGYNSK
ncbi:MAG TPA: hypothetical protein VII99_01245 [Bacteroidia bacterium]